MAQEILKKWRITENKIQVLKAAPEVLRYFDSLGVKVLQKARPELNCLLVCPDSLGELENFMGQLSAFQKGDLIWIAFAKKASSKARDFGRDEVVRLIDAMKLQWIALIALDKDWSAAGFRCAEAKTKKNKAQTPADLTIPTSLAEFFKREPKYETWFLNLSKTNRKEYIQWLRSAKKDETLLKRLELAKQYIKEGRVNPFVK